MTPLLLIVIVGTSMQPTIDPGDTLVVVEADTLARGDLVLFQFGYREKRGEPPLVKRLVGVPGDSLGGALLVPAFETRATIPPGHYYVRADNPRNRYDSRRYGLIARAQIRGRVTTGD